MSSDIKSKEKANNWSCFICGSRRQRSLELHTCARIPRHIRGFNVEPDNFILTTVCTSCVNLNASVEVSPNGEKEDIFTSRRRGVRGCSPVAEGVDEL